MEASLMEIVRSLNRSWIYNAYFSLYRPIHPGGKVQGKSPDTVRKSMRTTVRFLNLRDLCLGLARSLHGDLKWRGVHSNVRAVVKDLTCTGSRPNGCYMKSQYLYLSNSL